MADKGDVEILLTLEDGSVVKALQKIETQGKKSADNIGIGYKKLAGVIAGVAGAFAAAFSVKAAVDAAIEQQNAVNALNQALASAGTFTKEASQSFQDFAAEIEKTTVVTGAAVLGYSALARNFTRTNEEAQKLTKTAIDLAAATGISVDTAVRQLGGSLSGVTGQLGKVASETKGLTEEQLKAGAAIDIVAKRFAGAAAAQTNTFSGALEQSKNAFGSVLEQIGNLIVKSPSLVAGIKFIKEQFVLLSSSISSLASQGDPFKAIIVGAIDVTSFFTSLLGPAIETIVNLFKNLGNLLGGLAAGFAQLFSGEFINAFDTLTTSVKEYGVGIVESFSMSGTKAATTFLDGFKTAIETAQPVDTNFINAEGTRDQLFQLSTSFTDFLNQNKLFIMENKELFLQYALDLGTLTTNQIEAIQNLTLTNDDILKANLETAKRSVEEYAAIQKSLNQTILSGAVNTFKGVGAALAKGESGWAAFGKGVIGIIGDLAIAIGTNIIAQGFALSALAKALASPFTAPLAIAAGITLVALGGALKAIAGGGGGGPEAPTPTAGGGVGATSGGGIGTGNEIATNDDELEEIGPQVSITVQGNILDRRETGLELAEVIAEAFGGNAVVFST